MKNIETFDDMQLSDNLLRGILAYGFENPSTIQKQAIVPIIEKKDVIAQAQSGTGKTGTFTIGSLQQIAAAPDDQAPRVIALEKGKDLRTEWRDKDDDLVNGFRKGKFSEILSKARSYI